MKRFFTVVETEDAKRRRLEEEAAPAIDPRIIVSWNCNNLLGRLKGERTDICRFVEAMDPDVIALQEVRLPSCSYPHMQADIIIMHACMDLEPAFMTLSTHSASKPQVNIGPCGHPPL